MWELIYKKSSQSVLHESNTSLEGEKYDQISLRNKDTVFFLLKIHSVF